MRYFIGFLITIGLIALVLFLLFSGGSSAPTPKPLTLLDYTSNGNAQLIIDGPIVADQNHQTVQINVSSDSVVFTLSNGYDQSVTRTQAYPNNTRSFSVFLQALQHAGFTQGNAAGPRDERGYCPGSIRDIFSFANGSNQLMRFWATGCGQGTFKGNAATVVNLFKKQVPDYANLTQDVSFTHL